MRVGDSDFSLPHARVMQISSPFTFITEHKFTIFIHLSNDAVAGYLPVFFPPVKEEHP